MSEFSDKWVACMQGHGLPVPNLETLNEALEFIDKLHGAWENAGGGEELLIVGLIGAGAAIGLDEAALGVLATAGQATAVLYLGACIGCLGSAALGDLIGLNQQGVLPGYVVSILQDQGTDLNTAVA